jgi:hypothetical protein
MSYFCCEPKLAQENLELLNSILAEALAGVTAKELELAKQKIVAQILLASERTEARMFSVGGQWLNNQSFKTPAEIANQYRCVTLDQKIPARQLPNPVDRSPNGPVSGLGLQFWGRNTVANRTNRPCAFISFCCCTEPSPGGVIIGNHRCLLQR